MNNPYGNDYRDQIRQQAREGARQAREAARQARRQFRSQHPGQFLVGATAPVVGSLVLIGLGVALLGSQMGFFNFETIWRLWPIIFIIIGANKMIDDHGNHWIINSGLILFGALLLAHNFGALPFSFVQLWPLLLIVLGLELFWKVWTNPTTNFNAQGEPLSSTAQINSVNIFGGIDSHVVNPDFRGGQVLAIFGGFKLDLTRCDMTGESIRLEASAIFGGGEIIVPTHWNVVMNGVGILGGYTDDTHHVPLPPGTPSKTIFIEGAAIFGGVEVKN